MLTAKNDPVIDGRVIEQPQFDPPRGSRDRKIDLAIFLKCLRGGFPSVGNNPVDQFQAITIRFVFAITDVDRLHPWILTLRMEIVYLYAGRVILSRLRP